MLYAAIFAPWAAPLAVIAIALVSARGWPFHYELPWVIVMSALFGYLGLVAIALPAVYVLRRRGRLTLAYLALAGVLGGVLIFFVFGLVLTMLLGSTASFGWVNAAWGAALGLCVALAYGLIAGITSACT